MASVSLDETRLTDKANANFSPDVDRDRDVAGGLHRIPLSQLARARSRHADGQVARQGREEEEEEEGQVFLHGRHLQQRTRGGLLIDSTVLCQSPFTYFVSEVFYV